jgi:predicted nucleic acid-binding protein
MSRSMSAQVFDLDAALPGLLYWDASFLVHATYPAGRYHQACYGFLERLGSAENTLSCISTLALDETVFTLIRLKVIEDHPGQGFWDVYRQDPNAILPYLGELRTLVRRLSVDPRIRLVGTEREDVFAALELMDDYACLPRDAMHLAVMSRLGIDSIVTTDDDYLPVDGLTLFTSNPRILSPL